MKRLVVLLFAFCPNATARADTPAAPGKKIVPVTTVLEFPEDYSDYAFFEITHSCRPGLPPQGGTDTTVTLHFFAKGASAQATGGPRNMGHLFVIPRQVAEHVPSWPAQTARDIRASAAKHASIPTSDQRWVTLAQAVGSGEVVAAVVVPFGTFEGLPADDPRDSITLNYRLVRTSSGLAFVRPGQEVDSIYPRTTNHDRADAEGSWYWPAIFGSLAAFFASLWVVRRERVTPA